MDKGASDSSERVNYLLPGASRWPLDPQQPVISLRGVHKRFGDNVVLEGLDLVCPTGQTTVICGQSGSGKSVLLKLMNGLLLPDEGEVVVFGRDTRQMSPLELVDVRKRMTMLFQSYALMDSFTVHQNIAFPLVENTRMPREEIFGLVDELLNLLGLGDAGQKMPSELSGGMKKRVSLARAVISNPEVVLFDEPTTGLDPVMIEFVDRLLEDTRTRYGITSVIISHDMDSTLRLADNVAMLHEGRIVAYGSPEEVQAVDHPVVRVFFEGVEGDHGLKAEDMHETGGEVTEVESAVEVVDVHKSFGEHHVLKGVSLSVPPRKITVLIGGSGSGKSVIMKHIIGLLQPDSGLVSVLGQDVSRLDARGMITMRQNFGMLFQSAALLDSMSVLENVAFPLVERRLSRRDATEKAQEVLAQLQIAELGGRNPAEISAGQRKRVGLARAIATRPPIMIYDEPTTGQDPVMTRYVDDMIVEAQELFDITSLVVSHDMASAFRVAHQIAMLHDGEIRACGSPSEVAASADPWVRRFIYAGTAEGTRAAEELGLDL